MQVRKTRLEMFAFVLLALSVCTPKAQSSDDAHKASSAAETAMSGEEIKEAVVGNALTGGYAARPYTFYFEPTGALIGTAPNHGRWRLEGDVYCHIWTEFFGGVERCYRWFGTADGYHLKNVDPYRYWDITGKIVPGRPPGY